MGVIHIIGNMKRYITFCLLFFSCFIYANEPDSIIVNNRILVKVNGKTISVLDIMKKMNVLLNQMFPEYADSTEARFQFFATQWKAMLAQMIDHELILADAEKLEVKIKDADIREKLQERFGPNVVANLEDLGISYDEAREMVRTDLIVQRMTWLRIHSKAILSINPKDIKEAYRIYCVNNAPQDEWKYQSLSIRSSVPEQAEALSKKAYDLLEQGKSGLLAVAEELKLLDDCTPDTAITVSQEFCVLEKDLSDSHKAVLTTLAPGTFSQPLAQVSKDHQSLQRIFQLKEHISTSLPKFETLADKLEDQLIQKAITEETTLYIFKLRNRFGFDNSQLMEIPDSFEPFTFTGHVPISTH